MDDFSQTLQNGCSSPPTIAIDLGGTKIAAGLVVESTVTARLTLPTPPPGSDGRSLADALVGVVRQVDPDHVAHSIRVAVAGRVSPNGQRVIQAANLGLSDAPLAALISAASGRDVALVNDVHAALAAEGEFGAARSKHNALMVSLGTGVGGAWLIHGDLVRGAHGGAGEIGHAVVKPDGRECGCGGRGCLDQYASGRALVRFANAAGHGRSLSRGEDVTALARSGDPAALTAFAQLAFWLARGLANAVALVDPETIIIGGGLAMADQLLFVPLQSEFSAELTRRGVKDWPTITPSVLGADAPLLGAARLKGMQEALTP